MGTVILPPKIIKKLIAIMRNFFWGGGVDHKRMSYVAWNRITMPKGMGGRGLRSLAEMNKALVLKNVWKIATGQGAMWIQVIRAKYYPRSCFWGSNRRYNSSKFWKNLILIKPILYGHVQWKIGNGLNIYIYSQPWFQNWLNHRAHTKEQR